MTCVFGHPWLGGLFDDPDAHCIWSADNQLTQMLAFEAAWSRALGAVGRVDPKDAETVAQMIEAFVPDMRTLRAGTARDGLPVPQLVAALKQDAGPLAEAVHTGATSQDVIDTALALSISETLDLLDQRIATLLDRLDDLSKRFGLRALMGRTRMQAAQPITVADRIATWRSPLSELQAHIEGVRARAVRLQYGGAVGNRAALGEHADAVARFLSDRLELPDPGHAWHSARAGIVDFAGFLSSVSGALGKVGLDICLMTQQDGGEIELAKGGQSSAMPHKNNPILAELLVTLARFNATQISAMHHALVHEQERSGTAWALEWMVLPQMALAAARSLSAATGVVQQIDDIRQTV